MPNKRNIIGFEAADDTQDRAGALLDHVTKTRLAGKKANHSDVYRFALDIGLKLLEREKAKNERSDEAAA